MTIKQIQEKARVVGVKNIKRHKKEHLIRAIQQHEGNSPCFKNINSCGEVVCCWRTDCQS